MLRKFWKNKLGKHSSLSVSSTQASEQLCYDPCQTGQKVSVAQMKNKSLFMVNGLVLGYSLKQGTNCTDLVIVLFKI